VLCRSIYYKLGVKNTGLDSMVEKSVYYSEGGVVAMTRWKIIAVPRRNVEFSQKRP